MLDISARGSVSHLRAGIIGTHWDNSRLSNVVHMRSAPFELSLPRLTEVVTIMPKIEKVLAGAPNRQAVTLATTRAVKEILWHHRAGVLPGFESLHIYPVLLEKVRWLGGNLTEAKGGNEVLHILNSDYVDFESIVESVWVACNKILMNSVAGKIASVKKASLRRQVALIIKIMEL